MAYGKVHDEDIGDADETLLSKYPATGSKPNKLWAAIHILERIVPWLLVLLVALDIGWKVEQHRSTYRVPQMNGRDVWSGPLVKDDFQYGADRRYQSLDHKYDHLWDEALLTNYGMVALPPYNASGYSMEYWDDEGGIAMFHALHCLAGLRKALQRASAGEYIGVDGHDNPHWPHCMHYLRQAILCMADDTFEKRRGKFGELNPKQFIEGSYDVRTCRDHTKLVRVVDKYNVLSRVERKPV